MKARVFGALLAVVMLIGCASQSASIQPSIACEAEVVQVKHEVWRQELSSHLSAPLVWQGVAKISVRFLKPASVSGRLRTFGVLEARELAIDGKSITAGDRLRFLASESVLSESVAPDVLSNLRDVSVIGPQKANKAPEPTPGSVTPRANARVAPAPVVAHL